MKAQPVDIKESTGRSLCCTVFRDGGKKLLSKGHVISLEDVRLLETEGMEREEGIVFPFDMQEFASQIQVERTTFDVCQDCR